MLAEEGQECAGLVGRDGEYACGMSGTVGVVVTGFRYRVWVYRFYKFCIEVGVTSQSRFYLCYHFQISERLSPGF